MSKSVIILTVITVCLFLACKKNNESTTPFQPKAVNFEIPVGWPAPKYSFTDNPLTEEGIQLGRKLFYDGLLSKDGNFPCASCHQQIAGFATFAHSLSHGFNNQFTTRNAPGLANLAWQTEFHADGGINHLDLQPLSPITAPNEMAETIENVLNKLRALPVYISMFRAAFGDETINTQRLTRALSQFMLTMVSANSKYDQVKNGKATFSLPESLGYDIFKQKCATCHQEPFFTDLSYRNDGFSLEPVLQDFGRMRITRNAADSLKFKVPSLRNVMVTYPYAHDGRVNDIYQMLEHYNTGVTNGPTTDPQVKNNIPLSNYEKGQLVAFLEALTDTNFLNDNRFGPIQ